MISVIIPTFNEEKNIKNCLESLSNQTIPRNKYEIIIVDGQSKDRTVQIAKKYVDRIVIQKPSDCIGIERVRHLGFLKAEYNLIATTDADCIVPKDWVENIVDNLKEKDCVAVYGPVIIDNKKYKLLYNLINLGIKLISYVGIYYSMGANTAFVKKYYFKCGGYSDYGVGDDIEIPFRIKKYGKVKYNKKVYVVYSARRLEKYGFIKMEYITIKSIINTFILKGKISDYTKQSYNTTTKEKNKE